jgi:hypothetical protein
MRQLSTRWIWFWKVPLPLLWIGGLFDFSYDLLMHTAPLARPQDFWFQTIALLIGVPLSTWVAWKIKRITLDDDRLIVSNYWRSIQVPLRDVERVWPGPFDGTDLSGPFINLELKARSPFGRKIAFFPQRRLTAGRNPLLDELVDLVDRAKRRSSL